MPLERREGFEGLGTFIFYLCTFEGVWGNFNPKPDLPPFKNFISWPFLSVFDGHLSFQTSNDTDFNFLWPKNASFPAFQKIKLELVKFLYIGYNVKVKLFDKMAHYFGPRYAELKNPALFNRGRINPHELTLSQVRRVDRLMDIFKPCVGNITCEKLVKNLVREFIEHTDLAPALDVAVAFRSIDNQVKNALNKERMYRKKVLEVPPQVLDFLSGK